MLFRRITLSALCALSLGVQGVAFAQDQAADTGQHNAPSQSQQELAKAQADAMRGYVGDIMKKLEADELNHFMVLIVNYNMFSMVTNVRDSIKGAVNECSENNKEMRDQLNSRFEAWDEAVSEGMEESRQNIENLGLAQDYVTQDELKMVYKMVEATRKSDGSQFNSIPVTTPEACEFMLSKMDETQNSMLLLLRATNQSYPAILQKNQK